MFPTMQNFELDKVNIFAAAMKKPVDQTQVPFTFSAAGSAEPSFESPAITSFGGKRTRHADSDSSEEMERKLRHRHTERERRKRMNETLDELHTLLEVRSKNKTDVLHSAVHHIKDQRNRIAKLEESQQILLARLSDAQARLQQLAHELSQSKYSSSSAAASEPAILASQLAQTVQSTIHDAASGFRSRSPAAPAAVDQSQALTTVSVSPSSSPKKSAMTFSFTLPNQFSAPESSFGGPFSSTSIDDISSDVLSSPSLSPMDASDMIAAQSSAVALPKALDDTIGMGVFGLDGFRMKQCNDRLLSIVGLTREHIQRGHFLCPEFHKEGTESGQALQAVLSGKAASVSVPKRFLNFRGRPVTATATVSLVSTAPGVVDLLLLMQEHEIDSLDGPFGEC